VHSGIPLAFAESGHQVSLLPRVREEFQATGAGHALEIRPALNAFKCDITADVEFDEPLCWGIDPLLTDLPPQSGSERAAFRLPFPLLLPPIKWSLRRYSGDPRPQVEDFAQHVESVPQRSCRFQQAGCGTEKPDAACASFSVMISSPLPPGSSLVRFHN